MATTITGIGQSKVINALDTYNHTALNSGPYMVSAQLSVVPVSGAIIVIKQNGVTKASTPSPASSQIIDSLSVLLNCAANDVIAITVSSAVPIDTNINTVKGIINIHQGIS